MSISHRTVTVADASVHLLESGPTEGSVVLLLHGASFSSATWVQVGTIECLAKAGFRVIAVDLPGFGKSQQTSLSRDKWLGEFIEVTGIKEPVILTPSMSGGYAFPFATQYADRIAGLVAVAPVAIPQFQNQFGRITVPVLAIWGENDRTIPLTHADMLVKSVSDRQLVVIPGAGHAPYMSEPALFNKTLEDFVWKCFHRTSGSQSRR